MGARESTSANRTKSAEIGMEGWQGSERSLPTSQPSVVAGVPDRRVFLQSVSCHKGVDMTYQRGLRESVGKG